MRLKSYRRIDCPRITAGYLEPFDCLGGPSLRAYGLSPNGGGCGTPFVLSLSKHERGGRQPVAEYMEGFTFQYLDAQGLPTTDSQNIRAVQVQLTGRSEHADSQYPENEGYRTFTLRTQVVPRNLQER